MIIDPRRRGGDQLKMQLNPFPRYAILRLTTPHYKVWSWPIIKMGKIMELSALGPLVCW